jgi:hypothetical protein
LAADSVVDRVPCLERLADLASLVKSDEGLTQALSRISKAGCANPAECVANLRFVASIESGRGNDRTALAVLQRALQTAPDDDGLLETAASLASRLDLHMQALHSYEALAARHPDEPRWAAAVTAEKAAAVTSSMPY